MSAAVEGNGIGLISNLRPDQLLLAFKASVTPAGTRKMTGDNNAAVGVVLLLMSAGVHAFQGTGFW